MEGALIALAAATIAAAAVERLFHPRALQQLGLGLAVSAVAALGNLGVASVLLKAGRPHRSIVLEADAKHLLTDVWTTVGVLAAVGIVAWSGWGILDPLIALAVAANIVWTGVTLMRRSVSGLMDAALPEEDQRSLHDVLARYDPSEAQFHAIRTRQAGPRRFVSMHVLVPGDWTVHRGHELLSASRPTSARRSPG